MTNLEIFREDYLEARTWVQRKDGPPLNLLDNLNAEELRIAEREMISSVSSKDTWPIAGLGHIKSKDALPSLYDLLNKSTGHFKVAVAHSVTQISGDKNMVDIALEEISLVTDQYELLNLLFFLPGFKDQRTTALLHSFRNHKKYLIAYNATNILGLPTDDVVKRFR